MANTTTFINLKTQLQNQDFKSRALATVNDLLRSALLSLAQTTTTLDQTIHSFHNDIAPQMQQEVDHFSRRGAAIAAEIQQADMDLYGSGSLMNQLNGLEQRRDGEKRRCDGDGDVMRKEIKGLETEIQGRQDEIDMNKKKIKNLNTKSLSGNNNNNVFQQQLSTAYLQCDNADYLLGETQDSLIQSQQQLHRHERECRTTIHKIDEELQEIRQRVAAAWKVKSEAMMEQRRIKDLRQTIEDSLEKEKRQYSLEKSQLEKRGEEIYSNICQLRELRSGVFGPDIEDCQVGAWEDTGVCDQECDASYHPEWSKDKRPRAGKMVRTRRVLSQGSKNGLQCPDSVQGKDKDSKSDQDSVFSLSQTLQCNAKPCPQHCILSEWSDFGTCSAICGGGEKQRKRQVVQLPKYNGDLCDGDLTDSQACNNQPCETHEEPEGGFEDGIASEDSLEEESGSSSSNLCKWLEEKQNIPEKSLNMMQEEADESGSAQKTQALAQWSSPSQCTRACGGGVHYRSLLPGTKAAEECPNHRQMSHCNHQQCSNSTMFRCNVTNVVFLVDHSGSINGADTTKSNRNLISLLSEKLIKRLEEQTFDFSANVSHQLLSFADGIQNLGDAQIATTIDKKTQKIPLRESLSMSTSESGSESDSTQSTATGCGTNIALALSDASDVLDDLAEERQETQNEEENKVSSFDLKWSLKKAQKKGGSASDLDIVKNSPGIFDQVREKIVLITDGKVSYKNRVRDMLRKLKKEGREVIVVGIEDRSNENHDENSNHNIGGYNIGTSTMAPTHDMQVQTYGLVPGISDFQSHDSPNRFGDGALDSVRKEHTFVIDSNTMEEVAALESGAGQTTKLLLQKNHNLNQKQSHQSESESRKAQSELTLFNFNVFLSNILSSICPSLYTEPPVQYIGGVSTGASQITKKDLDAAVKKAKEEVKEESDAKIQALKERDSQHVKEISQLKNEGKKMDKKLEDCDDDKEVKDSDIKELKSTIEEKDSTISAKDKTITDNKKLINQLKEKNKSCNLPTFFTGQTRDKVTHNSFKVSFQNPVPNEVVILGALSFDGSDMSSNQIMDETSNGFKVRVDEPDDCYKYKHTTENIPWMVWTKGVHQTDEGIKFEIGQTEMKGSSLKLESKGTEVKFSKGVFKPGQKIVVFMNQGGKVQQSRYFMTVIIQPEKYRKIKNKRRAKKLGLKGRYIGKSSITSDGFRFMYTPAQKTKRFLKARKEVELINWLAIPVGSGKIKGKNYVAGITNEKAVDHNWFKLSGKNVKGGTGSKFTFNKKKTLVFGQQLSRYGPHPTSLRVKRVDKSQGRGNQVKNIEFRLREPTRGNCRWDGKHTKEQIGWMLLEE